ncbi:hypothetical protein CSC12_6443 (plasmid) [Klebsiella michiganensis]|nr:hypothetical protein CSC12_6443 [Klebsiella michiganensis]
MVPLIGHIKEKGAHFRCQQVGRCGAGRRGHPAECDRGRKINSRGDRQKRDAFW